MCVHDCLFHWLSKIIPTRHNFLTHHRPAIRAENKITKRTGELSYLTLCTYCRPMMSEKIMTSSKKWMEYEKTNIETKIKTEKKRKQLYSEHNFDILLYMFSNQYEKNSQKKTFAKNSRFIRFDICATFSILPSNPKYE